MTAQKKQIRYNLAAFLLLFLVSLYRQLSLRYLPGDPLRTWILYACYVLLICVWAASVQMRVMQKSMRLCMLAEAVIMLTGLTIRFLQDTFWSRDIRLVRVSGLVLAATILPLLLFGLYASLGIGRSDEYRIDRRWYILLLPVVLTVWLITTDENRHIVFYLDTREVQPNLTFHPGTAVFLMSVFGFLLMIIRVFLIYRSNPLPERQRRMRLLIPLIEPLLMTFFSLDYFLVSLGLAPWLNGREVIELYARIYYAEILTWEIYIYLGLVPVNTEYREIFEHSTVGMQILFDDGSRLCSEYASRVTPEMLKELQENSFVEAADGKELHIHRMQDGCFLWNQDVSEMQKTIDELNKSAESLTQEGVLLREELHTKNEEASLLAKNRIYDELTADIAPQLRMMKEITKKKDLTADHDVLLRQLCLIGTYVKRRCNLRLIQKETGVITPQDLQLSLEDMVSALQLMGTSASLNWNGGSEAASDLAIWLLDMLEYIVEYERFCIMTFEIHADPGKIRYQVSGAESSAPEMYPDPEQTDRYRIEWNRLAAGYEMIVTKDGDGNAA